MFDSFFDGEALWFSIPALLGTGVFLIRILMMLVGCDGGDGIDLDAGDADLNGGDSSGAFEILSVQGVSAFLMGFGWVGVGSHLGAGWSPAVSFGAGAAGGALTGAPAPAAHRPSPGGPSPRASPPGCRALSTHVPRPSSNSAPRIPPPRDHRLVGGAASAA